MVDTATLNRFFRWYYETQDVPKSQDGKGGYTGGTNTVQRNLRALFAYLAEEYEHPDPSRIGSGSCAAVQVPAGTVHAAPGDQRHHRRQAYLAPACGKIHGADGTGRAVGQRHALPWAESQCRRGYGDEGGIPYR